jgi:hypothetical protein
MRVRSASGRAAIRALIWRVASSPDNTGIRMSIKMTWGCQLSQTATASWPSAASRNSRTGGWGLRDASRPRSGARLSGRSSTISNAADGLARFQAEDGGQGFRVQRLGVGRWRQGQSETKATPLARGAVGGQFPAHEPDELAAQGQAEAGPALFEPTRGGLAEGLEEPRHLRPFNPRAGVADAELDRVPQGHGLECHPASGRELDGVADQVDEDLAQLHLVAHDPMRQGGGGEHQVEAPVAGPLPERGLGLRQEPGGIEGGKPQGHAPGLDLGHIQDVVDEGQEVITVSLDDGQALALGVFQLGIAGQDLGEAQDGVHGGADFVAHAGQEFALGLVGGLRPGLRLAHGVAGLANFRQIEELEQQMRLAVEQGRQNQAIRPDFPAKGAARVDLPSHLLAVRQGLQAIVQHSGLAEGANVAEILSQQLLARGPNEASQGLVDDHAGSPSLIDDHRHRGVEQYGLVEGIDGCQLRRALPNLDLHVWLRC